MKAMHSNGLKGQHALSPGQRPGYKVMGIFALRSTYGRLLPTGRKKGQKPFLANDAFALTGRWLRTLLTQGDALGCELFGLSGRLCGSKRQSRTQAVFAVASDKAERRLSLRSLRKLNPFTV